MKGKILTILIVLTALLAAGCSTTQNNETGDSHMFDVNNYTVETITVDGITVTYRAYKGFYYVSNPLDETSHTMNFFVPESYFEGETINGYTLETAPILLPNQVGGYMPGTPSEPGEGRMGGGANTELQALTHGYVVAVPGTRGRGTTDENGTYIGGAPAAIVDLKAAVRYLRYNDDLMAGDAEKIVSNGTSAGGALSSLLGATGNNADYEPYLEEIGAAPARDDVFAVSAYCPITNLDNADAAYEWQFLGVNDYAKLEITRDTSFNIQRNLVQGTMTDEQIAYSAELAALFPAYVNSLGLTDSEGNALTLDEEGNGTFKEYIKSLVIASAQTALNEGTDLSEFTWLNIDGNNVTDLDYDLYLQYLSRMKTAAAFDGTDLSTGENELFGNGEVPSAHFTAMGDANTSVDAVLADEEVVKEMNPMNYIGDENTTVSQYWRIRHGAKDSDTSLAVSAILAMSLMNEGYDVNYALPWGTPHSGDYDLDELFAWIDEIAL